MCTACLPRRPGVYREYMRDLCDRVSTSQSHNMHKLVGFEPFAPAALAFRIAVTAVLPDADTASLLVRPCPDPKFGDYQSNALMSLAKICTAKRCSGTRGAASAGGSSASCSSIARV